MARDWTEGFVVAEQQSLLFQGASDAGGDGVEQALEFRLGRGGDTVEAGLFIFEGVGAVDEEHVQVDVERQPTRWMRVTAPVRGPERTRNPVRRMRQVEIVR